MLSTPQFAQRAFIVFAIGLTFLALWKLSGVLLWVFGGIIIALVIRSAADHVARHLPLSRRWASLLVVLVMLAVIAVVSWLVGDEVSKQIQELRQRLPEAVSNAKEWLQSSELGRSVLAAAESASVPISEAATTATATFGVLSDIFLVLLIALYLSFSPGLYRKGAVELVPTRHQASARQALDTSSTALRGWLLGQLFSMAAVGVLTGVGLWIAGVPLAFILGLVAGLLEFVPVIGPLVAAIPGILLGFAHSPMTAAYAALVYLIVQQLEGAVIMPLAQKWSVRLPPALGLISIVIFGVLFGIPGILFATPLTVVIMALTRKFYIEQE